MNQKEQNLWEYVPLADYAAPQATISRTIKKVKAYPVAPLGQFRLTMDLTLREEQAMMLAMEVRFPAPGAPDSRDAA